ncbi:MAG: four helix bundle protein [bacterium]
MATFKRFEDINAWKKARKLTQLIYKLTSSVPFSDDNTLCWQIQKAAVSIMSNIAEGFARYGTREFIQFLFIAKGSCSEVKSQMYVALDNNYVSKDNFNKIYELAEETEKTIAGLVKYLKTKLD